MYFVFLGKKDFLMVCFVVQIQKGQKKKESVQHYCLYIIYSNYTLNTNGDICRVVLTLNGPMKIPVAWDTENMM